MKKFSFLIALIAVLGLNVSCSERGERFGDDVQREEMGEEIGHELDEAGDEMEEVGDDIVE